MGVGCPCPSVRNDIETPRHWIILPLQLDKKLETASRESDEKVERIQRKLDEAILQQQKDKKTNEETLDAFQADIDALEKEKQDLKVSRCVRNEKSRIAKCLLLNIASL